MGAVLIFRANRTAPPLQRELTALRNFRDTVEWFLDHCSPDCIARGLLDAGRTKSLSRWHNIAYCIQRAMPRREAAPGESQELWRLIRLTSDPASHEKRYAEALQNPDWYLWQYRRFLSEHGGRRADDII